MTAQTGEQSATPTFAHRCKRVRHRQSECRVCVEVCPEGAITLDLGPAVSERCTRCGLCQTACPTEVFQGEFHSDQRLLARIAPLLRPERRTAGGRALLVHCSEAEAQHRESVAVPCLGSVTGNFLLGAVALGANPLMLVRGDCGSCRLGAGKELLDGAIAAYTALAAALGRDGSAVKLERRQRNARASSARRKLLARVAGGGTQGSGDWPAPGIETGETSAGEGERGTGPTPGRAMLLGLLRSASWSPSPTLRYDRRLPWASLRIDQRECAACGTCVNLCPTGAITRRIADGRLAHHFSSALCVDCRLCLEACPQQVIGFDAEFDARDLVRQEARPITGIRLHACEICGDTLPEHQGRFCVTCQRRGRVENHVPGAIGAI